MAFFTPVQSGNHTFIVKSDDTSVLYLGKGNNISDLTELVHMYHNYCIFNNFVSSQNCSKQLLFRLEQ